MAKENIYDDLLDDELEGEEPPKRTLFKWKKKRTEIEDFDDEELDSDPENEEEEEVKELTPEDYERMTKVVKGYRIILIVLVVVLGFLTFQHFRLVKQQREDFDLERKELNGEISGLITEMDNLIITHDSVSTELMANIVVERDRADSLMNKLRSERDLNYKKIRQYEKELGTLRTIMQRYVHQIDSLNTLNKQLASENIIIRKEKAAESTRAAIAEERAEELNNQIRLGSIVKTRDVKLVALNSGGTERMKASRVSKFRVDMVLTANDLTIPGMRNVYVRITGPDGLVLSGGPDALMDFEGDLISYSAVREVDYENVELPVSLFFNWDNIVKGVYTAEIYMDGYLIGDTELALN